MDQLNKLIKQYERENPGQKAKDSYYCLSTDKDIEFYTDDFVLWIASRPTCGEEQRKFLDEIENNFLPIATDDYEIIEHNKGDSALESWDFGEIDFEKVIKGE